MKKIISFLMLLTTFCFLSCSTSSYSSEGTANSSITTSSSSAGATDVEDDIIITFLTVQEAFEKGDISRSHLTEMASLVNESSPLSIDSLPQNVLQGIKRTYSGLHNNVKLEEVAVEYFGVYDECYAVYVFDVNMGFATAVKEVEVAGIVFSYPVRGLEITICKGSKV